MFGSGELLNKKGKLIFCRLEKAAAFGVNEHPFDFDDGDFVRGECMARLGGDFLELVGVLNRRDEKAGNAAAAEQETDREQNQPNLLANRAVHQVDL